MTDELIVSAAAGAGGIISNVFEHKINEIKDYFLEKEMAKGLEPENLTKALMVYFEKLSKRVNEITTVAFPQHKLDFIKIYEPLTLIKIEKNDFFRETRSDIHGEKNFDIINQLKFGSGAYIIIDSAGMGKTTFSRYLVHEILYKSEKIPILFDLRRINDDSDLIELLAKELDFPWKVFSRDLFYRLLSINKFIIILDGFDEVAPQAQEHVASQIHILSNKCCDNSILLTSRPQEGLPDLINSNLLRFEELNIEQVKSLLLRYDKCSSSNVGRDLTLQLDKVPQNFLKTPLIVSLLYKTFGFNNSIADRLCTFYDDVYQALYKGHDLINKGGFSRKKLSLLDYEDFRKLVRALCYLMTVHRKVSFSEKNSFYSILDQAIRLTGIKPSSNNNFITDLLVSVPLMVKEGNEYKFIHKTILEYFAAEYIVYHSESYKKLSAMLKCDSFSSFSKIMDFVHDIDKLLYNKVITKSLATSINDRVKENDLFNNLVVSCTILANCKVGIFDQAFINDVINENTAMFSSDDSKDNQEGLALHVSLSKLKITSYMSRTIKIVIDNKFYFIGFARQDINDFPSFHHYAYSHICDTYAYEELLKTLGIEKYEYIEDDIQEYSSDILGVTAINKWNDLNENIPFISMIKDYIVDSMIGYMSPLHENTSVMVLSKSKINNFLAELAKEEALEKEIEMLL
ncbi:TPA: NACHT domain-containing protein [Aeromonas hydrophila]